MKRVIREDFLRRQHLTKDLKELESESEISGGALNSNALRLKCTGQVKEREEDQHGWS